MRIWHLAMCCLAIASLALAGCTTSQVRVAAPELTSPVTAGSAGLLVKPEARLAILTAAGQTDRRDDWSRDAANNLATAFQAELAKRDHPFQLVDLSAQMEGRTGQVLRLNEAVGDTIQAYEFGGRRLPTKAGRFDWTLGEGARLLRGDSGADHALFVTARGTWSSPVRKVLMVGAAIIGTSMLMGSQTLSASLVDLRTGRVIWYNQALAGPADDMRTPEGARSLAASVLKGAPL